ncbi:hypothetical protein HanIR_Chr12g0572341 [Helianthus annuus]|nr:hypothetical protein HanIR_Chr12g0572341 [Helianthus annuus]
MTTIITTITTLLLFSTITNADNPPQPTPWPEQFHSVLVLNSTDELQLIDLYYDWNNGTSFFFTIDSDRQCSSVQLDVGILRPNWLAGATYVGQRQVDGFDCYVWEKADFITYYEDVVTRRPVKWVFYTGREAHVMTFEVGAALEDAKWQVPWYCFEQTTPVTTMEDISGTIRHRGLVDFGTRRIINM